MYLDDNNMLIRKRNGVKTENNEVYVNWLYYIKCIGLDRDIKYLKAKLAHVLLNVELLIGLNPELEKKN